MVANIRWEDPFSPEGLREATSKVLTGMNYRLFFEGVTRRKLIKEYRKLVELSKSSPDDDEGWKRNIREAIAERGNKNLRYWLVGLTAKTATNLGLGIDNLPEVFDLVMSELENFPEDIGHRDTALLLWAGAATLTIRGSQKSKIGKRLEKAIAWGP